jgi:hypothetical protein
MSRFQTLLEELGRGMAVPEPHRGRLLEEVAADLEDLYAAYRGAGMGAREAERRALQRLLPGTAEAAELERLHRPVFVRLLDRLTGGSAGAGAERAALVLLSGALLAATLALLPLRTLLVDPSPFLAPVLALGCGALLAALWCTHRLFLRGDVSAGDAGRGLGLLLFLLLAAPYLAVLGLVVDFYVALGHIEQVPASATAELIRLLRSDGILLLSALHLSLLAALWWLALRVRVTQIRAAARALQFRARLVADAAPQTRGVA